MIEKWLNGEKIEELEEELQAPSFTSTDYENLVEQLIRERYSLNEELAINRQRETKTEEFNVYYEFCESCKIQAKQLCGIGGEEE